ncbi:MAG: FAD-dependent oxidoreductase [Aequorivita sp.]|nr:FAD-dependent oxidoreductase [Aequorivita sp.]|tara:strand:+ start:34904 stop:35947 length:1044 start_codon:yes stop_codon:yes gene_type:complete
MKNVDYIVVGLGIAGISLCEQLLAQNKSFIVIDNGKPGATANSGGVFNPTVLKRFTVTWNASQFYPEAVSFYRNISEKLNQQIFVENPILRVFKSVEEQNNWTVASDKNELQPYLSTEFLKNNNNNISAPLGFGKVLGTAQINVSNLLTGYRKYLKNNNHLFEEEFNYQALKQANGTVTYNNYTATTVIFAEGAGAKRNPFFPQKALKGNKGEYIIIKAPELKLQSLLKDAFYIIPLGDDCYKVGATFNRESLTLETTQAARDEIISKLKKMINCPFELVGQTAGIRPTTQDHKPLIGSVPQFKNIVFFNGLGSRGFLMAPLVSKILINAITQNTAMPKDMDINRML